MHFSLKELEFNSIKNSLMKEAKTISAKLFLESLVPSNDILKINKDLEALDSIYTITSRYGSLPLLDDFDIKEIIEAIKNQMTISLSDLFQLRLLFVMERDLISFFQRAIKDSYSSSYTENILKELVNHDFLLKKIDFILSSDGKILDSASAVLNSLRKKIKISEEQMTVKMNKLLIHYQDYLSEKIITIKGGKMVLLVKEESKNKVKGSVRDISTSGQTVYIEPQEISEIDSQLSYLKSLEKNEIERILKSLVEEISLSSWSISHNLNIFVELDILGAKACYAKKSNSERPNINNNGLIQLRDARHPLIDKNKVVAINLSLDQTKKTMIITGPNTGGKTVALKTLGLITIMAQSGLFIPCHSSSKIAVFDNIFADIGDDQSIVESLSTYSSHMLKVKRITDEVSSNDLVLIDELGSGTDPLEGVSLALAIIDYLIKISVTLVVTTHYFELKTYALNNPNIISASVAFDSDTLKPLYYLEFNSIGSSNALLIAKKLQLKEEILDVANNYKRAHKSDLSELLERLNSERLNLMQERKNYEEKSVISTQLITEYNNKILQLEKESLTIKNAVRLKEKALWEQKKAEVENVLNDLKKKELIKTPELASVKNLIKKAENESFDFKNKELLVDDEVYIVKYDKYGKIVKKTADEYTVKLGNLTLLFNSSELKKVSSTPKEAIKYAVKRSEEKTLKTIKTEIDLRGCRYYEVKEILDKAIDDSIYGGLNTLSIIHGFGKGVIRNAVHEYIKNSKQIKSSRYGEEGEGLNGVTIITLY